MEEKTFISVCWRRTSSRATVLSYWYLQRKQAGRPFLGEASSFPGKRDKKKMEGHRDWSCGPVCMWAVVPGQKKVWKLALSKCLVRVTVGSRSDLIMTLTTCTTVITRFTSRETP